VVGHDIYNSRAKYAEEGVQLINRLHYNAREGVQLKRGSVIVYAATILINLSITYVAGIFKGI